MVRLGVVSGKARCSELVRLGVVLGKARCSAWEG